MKNNIAKNIHLLNLSISSVIMRFYLMMAIVISFGFAGYLLTGAIVAFLVAFSTIVGLSFKAKNVAAKKTIVKRDVKAEFVERVSSS